AQAIQTNIVRVDGQRSVYLPILKQGGETNTIAVVDGIKEAISNLVDIPKQLIAKVVFDQSVFVRMAIENLLHEGAIGLVLTVLAATITTAIVFFPVVFLYGVSRFLFVALAMAVVLSLAASYIVAMTVVPLFCAKLIHKHEADEEVGESEFGSGFGIVAKKF